VVVVATHQDQLARLADLAQSFEELPVVREELAQVYAVESVAVKDESVERFLVQDLVEESDVAVATA
jgi:hypothetical protein